MSDKNEKVISERAKEFIKDDRQDVKPLDFDRDDPIMVGGADEQGQRPVKENLDETDKSKEIVTQQRSFKDTSKMKISSGPVGQTASLGSRLFDIVNYTLITLIAFTTILPFIYIVGASFATEYELTVRPMFLWPQDMSLDAYKYVFSSNKLMQGFGNSVFITVVGTIINLFATVSFAYPLSKKKVRGRNFLLNMVIVSMFFSGGMIPGYLLVSNWLGLKGSYLSVLLPGAISAYNMMIVKNFFAGLPQELEESAHIDGCNDLLTLIKIVLPLSLPVLATFGLFYAVGHWNSYFSAMIYLSNARDKWPLQVMLREIIITATMNPGDLAMMDPNFQEPPAQSVKMAVIVVSTVPIMCVYPFLQKYFVKGVMVGALKG